MPKRYRIALILYDEEDTKLHEESHEETYENDAEASERFELKDQAARKAGGPKK